MTAADIVEHPIHLGLGATADVEPSFTGSEMHPSIVPGDGLTVWTIFLTR